MLGGGLLAGQNVWSRGAQLGTEAHGRKDKVKGFGRNSGTRRQGSRGFEAALRCISSKLYMNLSACLVLLASSVRRAGTHARTHAADSNRDIPPW